MAALTLEAVERLFHQVVRGALPVEEGAAQLGADPRRLRIYRNFVRTHVRKALEANFRALPALLATATWDALVDAYEQRHPPTHWGLNLAARDFPAFLEAELAAGREGLTELHVCVAQLEWETYTVNVDPAPLPDPRALAAPVVNPTLSILSFPYDVVPVVLAARAGRLHADSPLPDRADPPLLALLFRRPQNLNCGFYKGTDDLLFALKVTHDGLSPEQAAEAAGQPLAAVRGALDQAAAAGLIIRPA